MTDQARRPWWASDTAGEPGGDVDDLLERHRRARRGVPPPSDETASAASPDPTGAGHGGEVCGLCPICVGLRLLGELRPGSAAHLAEAAQHLAAAVRDLVEPPAAEPRPGREDPDDGLERIDLG